MTTTRIGSVFSGIGAMDLAAERHFKARTAWFCEREPYAQKVLAARWPGVPIFDDVTTLADEGAEPVDILIGGPPCVDLSYAGRRAGLTAERSGLFFDFVQVAARMDPQPRWVVVENVPALLAEFRGVVESEFAAAGYGVTWAKVAAAHVEGCPHLRKRVFVLAELGKPHSGVCDAGPIPGIAVRWPTPAATMFNDSEEASQWAARAAKLAKKHTNGNGAGVPLPVAVQDLSRWPAPRAGQPGSRRPGTGGKVLGEMVRVQAGRWPGPKATDDKAGGYQRDKAGKVWPTLTGAVGAAKMPDQLERGNWPTPAARDHKDGAYTPNVSLDTLGRTVTAPCGSDANLERAKGHKGIRWATPAACDDRDRGDVMTSPAVQRRVGRKQLTLSMQAGARLNPDWVETLQGLPPGWTDIDTDKDPDWLRFYADHLMTMPRWPAPMVKGMWGDSPQHRFEPPRTIAGKQPNRSARLKALGNCLPPQQYLLALQLLEQGPAQATIFELLGAP